jgi:hypothetical protein
MMLGEWWADLESLEAISQDDETKALVLRLAAMSQAGTLQPFLAQIHGDRNLDAATRATFAELAADESFLLAVEDYVRRTRVCH